MRRLELWISCCLAALTAALPAAAQTPSGASAEGRSLATLAPVGEQRTGLWVTRYGGGGPMFDVEAIRFRPWAQGLFDTRQEHDLEPCWQRSLGSRLWLPPTSENCPDTPSARPSPLGRKPPTPQSTA